MRIIALAAVQALLPLWLGLTDADVPASMLDDHRRLPSAWHHNTPARAALNFLAALALVWVFRSAANLRTTLSRSAAVSARRLWERLLYVIGLVLSLTGMPLPRRVRPPLPAVALPRLRALTVLLHRMQPCAP
ncbi:hypothetical protein OHT77_14755 [Streptomyces sp. NBC_00252]|uniref:hypothetical protein n=1 Tax=Streptomyces sp. NBC_00252 TaxID=2975691 RepID=UPI002E2D0F4B|nr:hypothetical protein [Streptomyces sp. NBC_00252]